MAEIPLVRRQIIKPQPEGVLLQLAEEIRQETGAEFIVIGNREGIRFSHPKPDRLGKQMVGGDNAPALDRGESYISRAVGTLSPSIRGKVPIFDEHFGVAQLRRLAAGVDDEQVLPEHG